MDYDFRKIEKEWQEKWKANNVYQVSNDSPKPKCYVLDMFPYPSGAGLHVGHPLGYIASDIYSRYKRLKGFNVLHPMGFDSFGLPAEQYALETGQHPAETTKKNIATFKSQLDKIGFCYDWSREVQTSDPAYYKWTQWLFLKLYNSYYCNTKQKARPVSELVKKYESAGSKHFTADEWKGFSIKEKEEWLMKRRLAFSAFGEVNWCEALGTVLANDEVVNGVSERGGHPVEKKKMRQWFLRITAYADRLLEGLESVEFSEAMKEMQKNWIGRSEGAEIEFRLTPNPSPVGEGGDGQSSSSGKFFKTADKRNWAILKDLSRENRKNKTEAEEILWGELRNSKLGYKVRRQHVIEDFIIDFAFTGNMLLVEVDGGYHESEEQKNYDKARTELLKELGYEVIRFSNDEVINDTVSVIASIKKILEERKDAGVMSPLSGRRGDGGEALKLKVYTTRPDTIFGVDFMVIAPEHELVQQITTSEQKEAIDKYLAYVKSRSDRERQAETKTITGCFTGAYAINPFDGRKIPVWTAEYVLAGYGTGAIMAVPCGDQRDFLFANHFNIPITNIIGSYYNGDEANPTKDAILENSGFMNGMLMKDAIGAAVSKIEEMGIGKRKVNYKMRDAGFSRQRYWGEPFPIVWQNGVAIPLDEKELPLELPHVEKYGPGPNGEGPLANLKEWTSSPSLLHPVKKGDAEIGAENDAKGSALVPKYKVNSPLQYELARQMRKEYTDAEGHLWQHIRANKLDVKFRRQHPIDSYIADFVCLQQALIIEVDGGYHETTEQKTYDEERTRVLNEIGFTIIRFKNEEVLNNTEAVIIKIKEALAKSKARSYNENVGSDAFSHPSPHSGEGQGVRETSTMPGYAGSSWYFLRYMDPHNSETFCDRKISDYWNQVDLYVGGTEHAVGHLLYSRMWTKVLFDLDMIGFDEPYRKLLNQGMIQGSSRFVFRVAGTNQFVSNGLKDQYSVNELHVDVNMVDGIELDMDAFRNWKNGEFADAEFLLEDGKYICGVETEKMSKSKYNTVNPDVLCEQYGADTFRMYEMFLGPVEASKPWDTKGIEGVHRFLRKLWRLFFDEQKGPIWTSSAPSPSERAGGEATEAELKVLHRAIKKIEEDTERFSFNTAVSTFMICVNELADLKCHKKEILQPLLILLSPYAPHISDELWHQLGNSGWIMDAAYPALDATLLVENSKEYPVSINGKLRTTLLLLLDLDQKQVEESVLKNEIVQKWLEGKAPKKIIFVKGKMINVVV